MGLGDVINKNGISCFGIINYNDLAPLLECRAKNRIPENSKSVIVCLFPYKVGDFEQTNISKYAMITDYHIVAGEILQNIITELKEDNPQDDFEYFVDNSPVCEVDAGLKAGLGVKGKNGLLINEKFGSYVFIGEIITTKIYETKLCEIKKCIGCNKCINACPSKALTQEGFNIEICRSHITQKKRDLTDDEIKAIKDGGLVWGCDICNDVCPMNKNVKLSDINAFYKNVIPVVTKQNIKDIFKQRAFNYRGKNTINRNIDIIKSEE